MSKAKRAGDWLSDEQRQKYIKAVISYFHDERDEEIGVIAAGELLDFLLQEAGTEIYRRAIGDVKKMLKKNSEELDTELDILLDK